MSGPGLRVGVDVGGTFTKAVAVSTRPLKLRAQVVVPTTHRAGHGVVEGIAEALRRLLSELGEERDAVEFVAYSTTTAMNALLEGDVATVGVIGIGARPELRRARKRTRVGQLKLAPGRALRTEHEFLDAGDGLEAAAIDAAIERLARAGCTTLAVSGAFSVDAPEHEEAVVARARAHGLPVCAGHELTGVYGLEVRTISAAVNASILPTAEDTAGVVERVLRDVDIDVPLLALRGDGGAMSLQAFRSAPSLSIGSGPAAGVAAALQQLGLRDGIVLECGGTSSNVTVVKDGGTVLRDLRVMGRRTAIRSVDSWVVGVAGGSMPRLGRRRVEDVGPRSAHMAGLPYACFADASRLAGATAVAIAPRDGDPRDYAAVRTPNGETFAVTATCAARAPESESARIAFDALARGDGAALAREVLAAAARKIADAVADAARVHDLAPDVPLVALGGAGGVLVPEVARRLGRPLLRPEHPEILSSIGAALSLVRAEVVRHADGPDGAHAVARDAERACVRSGAAPLTITVHTRFEPRDHTLRAVATGAVALESRAVAREPLDEAGRRHVAAAATGGPADTLRVVADTGFYRVYSDDGRGRVAIVDDLGSIPACARARHVISVDDGEQLLPALRDAVDRSTNNLGIATLVPRVSVLTGPHLVDLSDSRRAEDIMAGAAAALAGNGAGPAVAVVWR